MAGPDVIFDCVTDFGKATFAWKVSVDFKRMSSKREKSATLRPWCYEKDVFHNV